MWARVVKESHLKEVHNQREEELAYKKEVELLKREERLENV